MLTLIAAQDQAGAIGRDNGIPWHIPEDLAFFKQQTAGGAVIMGRRTWDSLPRRPLPNRLNLVVSRRSDLAAPGALVTDLDGAQALARRMGHDRLFCIGGAEIYRQMLPLADRVLLSKVDLRIKDADAFFPQLDQTEWRLADRLELRRSDPACIVETYLRR